MSADVVQPNVRPSAYGSCALPPPASCLRLAPAGALRPGEGVWTGEALVFAGGVPNRTYPGQITNGMFDPASDTWTVRGCDCPVTSGSGAWTGELILAPLPVQASSRSWVMPSGSSVRADDDTAAPAGDLHPHGRAV